MKFLKLSMIVLAGSLVITACGEKKESEKVAEDINEERFDDKKTEKDASFVTSAITSSYDEVALADLAIAKSSDPSVRDLAKELKDDHSNIVNELKALAAAKTIATPDSASRSADRATDRLEDNKGADFNKKWLAKVEDMHEESVKKYEDAAKNCTDSSLRTWAGNNLTKMIGHLNKIKDLKEKTDSR